jgi:PAS domain-containing protein
MEATTGRRQKNLALIRAREVATNLSLPMVVLDAEGLIVFYNAAAEEVAGWRFAETGEVTGAEWAAMFRPEYLDGRPAALEELPAGVALRERRADHQKIRFTSLAGEVLEVSITAFPLMGREHELFGAVTIFWLER